MEITDFSKGHWAMVPEKYDALAAKVLSLTSPEAMAEKMAAYMSSKGSGPELDIRDGVAVIGVSGPITKKETWLSWWLGGTGMDRLAEEFQAALDDPAVDAIVLDIDSPGGTLPGLVHMAAMIKSSVKPVVDFSGGLIASAAYWVGCPASKIILSPTAEAGSIGILMVHSDYSAMDKSMGIKRTFLTAGKYKAVGNSASPLSKEDKAVLQDELDYLYDIFASTVATGRGTSKEDVLANMADGRIFIGQQAIDAGLADAVGSLEDAITAAADLVTGPGRTYYPKSGQAGKEQTMAGEENSPKTTEQLAALYPEMAAALRQEGAAQAAKDNEGTKEAVSAETDRLKGLVTAQFGEEQGKAFAAIIGSGVSVEQFQAIRGTSTTTAGQEDDKGSNAKVLAALKAAGAEDPGAGGGGQVGAKDFMAMVGEYKAANKCSQFAAMQAVMKAQPEAHAAFLKKAQAN